MVIHSKAFMMAKGYKACLAVKNGGQISDWSWESKKRFPAFFALKKYIFVNIKLLFTGPCTPLHGIRALAESNF